MPSVNRGVEFLNRQSLAYFGRPLQELKSWRDNGAIHPDDLGRVSAAWMESTQTGRPYDDVHRLRRFDGTYRWFHARATFTRRAHAWRGYTYRKLHMAALNLRA
ncbi:MAG TPA: PAS domain-containing protein [Steroidobacteraceae bacterium]|nr:PAS domain-containing protein [Steroidobacteraceae bacterium]